MMAPDRWREVEDLCHAALACHGEERMAFLADACRDDDELRREVESLLAQQSNAEAFMRVPAAALAGSAALDQPDEADSLARASGRTRSVHSSALAAWARSTVHTTRHLIARWRSRSCRRRSRRTRIAARASSGRRGCSPR